MSNTILKNTDVSRQPSQTDHETDTHHSVRLMAASLPWSARRLP